MKRNLIFVLFALSIGIIAGLSVVLYDYFYPEKYIKTDTGEYVNVTVASQTSTFPITTKTRFEIEYYYADEGRVLTETVDEIPVLLGCDKEGLEKYLKDYMTHLSTEEREEGLSDYELVSYNGDVICLRKTYKVPEYEGFYVKNFNGYIVIMNGDEKTVYEYTQISVHLLPEDIREQVQDGYYIEDEATLYNFLEAYSS